MPSRLIEPEPKAQRMAELMVGLRKTSLVDYPGRIAATLFLPGCNLRCPWCHNRELVEIEGFATIHNLSVTGAQSPVHQLVRMLAQAPDLPSALPPAPPSDPQPASALSHATAKTPALIPLSQALDIIQKRKNVLGGVAITGGEPTLRPELPYIVSAIHWLGLEVKLDTNGTLPLSLEKLLLEAETRPDYVAMDLKLAPDRYRELLPGSRLSDCRLDGCSHSFQKFSSRGRNDGEPRTLKQQEMSDGDLHTSLGQNLRRSAELLRQYGIPHEFRTLALPASFITQKDIVELAALVDESPWYFAGFRGGNCLDPQWDLLKEPDPSEVEAFVQVARALGKHAMVRGM